MLLPLASEKIYNELKETNFDIIYDDRDESVGKKYADMDLIGVPFQIIIGPRDLKRNNCELKDRKNDNKVCIDIKNVVTELSNRI